jgi:perosamine synthetase
VIRLADHFTREQRDRLLAKLRERKIGSGNYFRPIHLQPYYREQFGYRPGDFPVTEHVADRTIALPFYGALTETDVDHVVATLKQLLHRI